MEHSAHGESKLDTPMTKPSVVAAKLVVLAVIGLLAGYACGGSAADTYYAQWPRGGTSPMPRVTGSIELLLFDSGGDQAMFQATGKAKGDGLIDNGLYSLWLADQEGNALLIDSGRADEECDVNQAGEETDCEVEVTLRSQVLPAPFQVTSLVGLTATISEGAGSIGLLEQAPIVVSFTVTEADL